MSAHDAWLEAPYQAQYEAQARADWEAEHTCDVCGVVDAEVDGGLCDACADDAPMARGE